MSYLAIDACSYCFGAAGTTSAVLDRLPRDIPCVFFGAGSSLEFLRDHPRLERLVEVDTENWDDLARHASAIAGAAVMFTNTNPVMTAFARANDVPVVTLDIIPWLHPSLADQLEEVRELHGNVAAMPSPAEALELCAGATALLQAYLLPFRIDPAMRDARLVPPVLHPAVLAEPAHDREPALLVSFGGLFNPDVDDEVLLAYAQAVADAAVEAAGGAGLGRVELAGPERLRELGTGAGPPAVTAGRLEHAELIERLRTASHAAIVPGLTTIYEAFAAGPPALLLPPTNLSQLRQVQAVRARGLADPLDVSALLGGHLLDLDADDEARATRAMADELARGLADGSLAEALRRGFDALLVADVSDPLVRARRATLDELGTDGAAVVAGHVASAWAAAAQRAA